MATMKKSHFKPIAGKPRIIEIESENPNRDIGGKITIKLLGDQGFAQWFKMGRNESMYFLKKAYARAAGKLQGELQFLFHGTRIDDDHTANSLGIPNLSLILVFEMHGPGVVNIEM